MEEGLRQRHCYGERVRGRVVPGPGLGALASARVPANRRANNCSGLGNQRPPTLFLTTDWTASIPLPRKRSPPTLNKNLGPIAGVFVVLVAALQVLAVSVEFKKRQIAQLTFFYRHRL